MSDVSCIIMLMIISRNRILIWGEQDVTFARFGDIKWSTYEVMCDFECHTYIVF